jgi:hypothetical protein
MMSVGVKWRNYFKKWLILINYDYCYFKMNYLYSHFLGAHLPLLFDRGFGPGFFFDCGVLFDDFYVAPDLKKQSNLA